MAVAFFLKGFRKVLSPPPDFSTFRRVFTRTFWKLSTTSGSVEHMVARLHSCPMILIVAGLSGSGKTTVGAMLAERLRWRFADADDFHPAANVEKMRAGVPLTDDDRWTWLRAIGAWMDERITGHESAVVTCSALQRSYQIGS